jgi:hypothetical protein
MCGGILVSMFLTLFVVPSAYVILNSGAERLAGFVTRDRSSAPPPPSAPPRRRREPSSVAGD